MVAVDARREGSTILAHVLERLGHRVIRMQDDVHGPGGLVADPTPVGVVRRVAG